MFLSLKMILYNFNKRCLGEVRMLDCSQQIPPVADREFNFEAIYHYFLVTIIKVKMSILTIKLLFSIETCLI